jgi:hypothetical protein
MFEGGKYYGRPELPSETMDGSRYSTTLLGRPMIVIVRMRDDGQFRLAISVIGDVNDFLGKPEWCLTRMPG